MHHMTILNSHFGGGAKLQLDNTAKHVKKEQRQVNKKFCEFKVGTIGIVHRQYLVCLGSIADGLG